MRSEKVRVAFLWHFHQPMYKDFLADEYVMPWVRLHALKDYYDMGAIMASVDGARATFNFVGSLLLQLDDYANGQANDVFLRLTAKPADSLDETERQFLLENFFSVSNKVIAGYPRYSELLTRRNAALRGQRPASSFSKSDFLDLQVLFNLAWSGNTLRRESPVVKALEEKRSGFTEDEKLALLDAQQSFLSRVTSLYRKLASDGAAELSTTPFFHPILPLIANVGNARECMPNVVLPSKWSGSIRDAKRQVHDAAKLFADQFGVPLRGMWPAEGSVSQDTCGIYTKLGIKWIATDEAILSKSLSQGKLQSLERNRAQLYAPHFVKAGGRPLSVFFRDHELSDTIGFVYSSWKADEAVSDFLRKLSGIRDLISGTSGSRFDRTPPIVSVILDGENAWQHYADNGEPFLRELYSRLVRTEWVELVRFGDYVEEFGPGEQLPSLAAGSWIRGDFSIWIGHPEDNQAWDYVAEAREALVKSPPSDANSKQLAWQSLFAAEGSDWNWWFGDDHSCDNILQFDHLFRKHIANVFSLIGREPPFDLSVPIKKSGPMHAVQQPTQFIGPVIDGKDTTYFEWVGAGVFEQQSAGHGAMHQVATIAKKLYFGFDLENLFIRVDFAQDVASILDGRSGHEIAVYVTLPSQRRAKIVAERGDRGGSYSLRMFWQNDGGWKQVEARGSVGVDRVLEMAIPFEALGCAAHDKIMLAVKITRNHRVIESIPEGSLIEVTVPGPEFEQEEWCV